MTRRLCALLFSFASANAFAAACCGGGFAAPSLITGDDRAQLTVSASHQSVTADVGADQLWRRREDGLALEDYRLEGARIFADRWQYGGTLPIARRAVDGESRVGLGDVGLNLGYEALPDWTYSAWRPKGLAYLRLTLPTGQDAWGSGDPLDARGRGFWALGTGAVFTKIFGRYDAVASLGAHYSFARAGFRPGWGEDIGIGGGYNWARVRLGLNLATLYESGVANLERVTTASASLSYLFDERWATTLTFTDQALFGAPSNTTVGRGVMLWAQRRWPR